MLLNIARSLADVPWVTRTVAAKYIAFRYARSSQCNSKSKAKSEHILTHPVDKEISLVILNEF